MPLLPYTSGKVSVHFVAEFSGLSTCVCSQGMGEGCDYTLMTIFTFTS